MCLRCGHSDHIRADGACITCGCPALVSQWEESTPVETPTPEVKRVPLVELEASEK